MCCNRWQRCHSCCTVPCVKLMSLSQCLIGVSGMFMLLTTVLLILWDPVTQGAFDFGQIINFTNVEMIMGGTSAFLLCACCVGGRFTRTKSRLWGILYLCLLLAGVAAQAYAFGHNVISQRNLQILEQITSTDLNETLPPELLDQISDSEKIGLQNAWYNFADTVDKYKCSIGGGGVITPSSFADSSDKSSFARALNTGEDVLTKCKETEREVTCPGNTQYGTTQAALCKGGGDNGFFRNTCAQCHKSYMELWLVTDDMTDKQKEELASVFEGKAGTMFCRCMSSWLKIVGDYETIIFWITFGYLVFIVLLLYCVVWVILCGPDYQPTDETTEMENMPTKNQYGQELVQVQCPFDCGPGDQVVVTNPHTYNAERVIVPEGVYQGMMFQVYV